MLSLKLIRGSENADGVRPVTLVPTDQARFVLGRDPTCDWPIPDKKLALSARHCEIVRIEGKQVLRDLSTNGTFVNGARERLPADHLLRHGDRFAMGTYLVEVSVVPDTVAVAAKVAAPPAPAAPRRGGDPAAMVGNDWERAATTPQPGASAVDAKTGFTRISKPPSKDVLDEMRAAAQKSESEAAVAEALPPAREAVQRAPPGTTDVMLRLAGGLGIPVEMLGTHDPAVAAERVARLLRVSVGSLHRQLLAQARQLRDMGSRTPVNLARSEAAPLRLAQNPEETMTALLGAGEEAGSMLMRANIELGQHSERLVQAVHAAGQRLGEQLAPESLERTAGGVDDLQRLWKIYGSLWTALGVGVGKSWHEGFGEAVTSYVAAAYDDPQQGERGGAERAGSRVAPK